MARLLALAGSVVFGAADFMGGLASRRWAAIPVVLVSQAVGMALLAIVLLIADDPFSNKDFWIGALAGVAGFSGLILFFKAFEGGAMSIVAPTTSAATGIIPVLAGLLFFGEEPGVLGLLGAAVAIVSIGLLSTGGSDESTILDRRQSLVLALLAGVGFGTFFVIIGQTSVESGLWPLAGARLASIPIGLGLVALTKPPPPQPGAVRIATGSGVLDMAGNILTLLALQRGLLSLIGVLASLYPASTVLLARIVLAERLTNIQTAGVLMALVGVALIAVA